MNSSSDQLWGIILPPPPPEAINYISILISIVAIALFAIILAYKLYQSGFKYKIQILQLRSKLIASTITPKQAAYKLANILQFAHNTNNLAGLELGIKKSEQLSWYAFIGKLSDYRYGNVVISQSDVLSLLNDAKSWTTRISS